MYLPGKWEKVPVGKLTLLARGLPLGYLSQLEHRLSETEAALYGALTSLRSLGQPSAAPASRKTDAVPRQKAALMKEWSQLPLREWHDMERWLTTMSDQFTMEQPGGLVPESSRNGRAVLVTSDHEIMHRSEYEPHAGPVSDAWQARDGRVRPENPSDAQRPRTETEPMASPICFGHQATTEHEAVSSSSAGCSRQGTTGVDDVVSVAGADASARGGIGRPSKAEELSRNKPSLYF
ncbi:uncharacterized protein N7515_002534 [Penicillium bovifimosum]|uniref:Uncharacterized protein n=1 Tax=Penicillium bovifimosum TaxID=126998 RepID=A0A9W9L9S2_9EURO|nr:uncharacterized protein N7515_002534 [Penicillium bovifimosum]KAJ5143747.1 hypothetical protein N7515_002534 [Penicillium bovifimosum]